MLMGATRSYRSERSRNHLRKRNDYGEHFDTKAIPGPSICQGSLQRSVLLSTRWPAGRRPQGDLTSHSTEQLWGQRAVHRKFSVSIGLRKAKESIFPFSVPPSRSPFRNGGRPHVPSGLQHRFGQGVHHSLLLSRLEIRRTQLHRDYS